MALLAGVLRRAATPATAVTVVFAVTLSVFPAVTALTLAGDGCEGGWGGLFASRRSSCSSTRATTSAASPPAAGG